MAALLDEEILEYELITKKLNVTRTVIRALEEQNVARIESEQVWRNPIKNRKKEWKEVKDMGMEIQILDWLQKLHTPVLDKIMCLITRLGDAGILWILLAAVLLLIPKTRKSGLILAGALVVDALLCNLILKPLVARIRPYDVNTAVQLLVSKPVDYSFPSGHTAASFASVVALFMAEEGKLWKPALVLAVLIAF